MHKRAEIKSKVVEMLQGSSAFSGNVYKSRYLPINKSDFPAASVYCPEDSSEIAASGEHYNRSAKVAIMIYCKGYDASEAGDDSGQRDIDSELDDLTSSVEEIFFSPWQTLEGTVYRMHLINTRYMVDTKSDDIIGVATMEFNAEYKDSLL